MLNNDEFREYLLGTLDAERRTALEERMLCDAAVYEELLAVEEELIDEYMRGGLTRTDLEQFETHFLITADRHKNLRFGKLLKRYIDSHSVPVPERAVFHHTGPTPPAERPFLRCFPSFSRGHAFAVSTMIAICLGVIVLWWLVVGKSVQNDMLSASRVKVVSLAPGSTMSAGVTPKRVTMPPRGVDLKLELEVTNTHFPNYKSKLFRESEPVQTYELKMEVKGDHNIVPLTINGENLSPGEYSVKLCGVSDSGEKEFIDSYSFRVTTD